MSLTSILGGTLFDYHRLSPGPSWEEIWLKIEENIVQYNHVVVFILQKGTKVGQNCCQNMT